MDDREIDEILTVDKVDNSEERDKEMVKLFRQVFTTDAGRKVLHQILVDLRYFDECRTDSETALNNYAKFMIINRLKIDNTRVMTESLLDSGLFKQ